MKFPIIVKLNVMNERHLVTLANISLIIGMLLMAREDPKLWDIELFKTILTAFSITGFLNMTMGFHFTSNKSDEKKTENTAAAFAAIQATAESKTEELKDER